MAKLIRPTYEDIASANNQFEDILDNIGPHKYVYIADRDESVGKGMGALRNPTKEIPISTGLDILPFDRGDATFERKVTPTSNKKSETDLLRAELSNLRKLYDIQTQREDKFKKHIEILTALRDENSGIIQDQSNTIEAQKSKIKELQETLRVLTFDSPYTDTW